MSGPVQTNIIFVPVPSAGVDFGRREYPNPHRHHRARRETWPRKAGDIPPVRKPDVELIERMKRAAREALEQARPQIQAALALARAA
jgi:hypothetical protein